MKSFKNILLITAGILFINAAPAPLEKSYLLDKGYTVTIHGTSNLHDWDETVKTVTGSSQISWNTDGSFNLEGINIKMNVRSIKSDVGAVMNNNTYKALKGEDHPEIVFALTSRVNAVKVNQGIINAKGNLTIAGVTKTIDIKVTAVMKSGRMEFEGSQTIKMTDFGVTPPVALFGTMKTGDEITISFKTVFIVATKSI